MNRERKRLEKWAVKVEACEAEGHRHPERVLVQYNPRTGNTLVECSGCGFPYDRMGNEEERNSYNEMGKLEMAI